MKQADSNQLHITVGVAPNHSVDLTHELALLKAALLYADKVRFCSISASYLILMTQFANLPGDQMLEAYSQGISGDQRLQVSHVLEVYNSLKPKRGRYRNKAEIIAYTQIEQKLSQLQNNARKYFEKLAVDNGIEALVVAVDSGLVDIQIIGIGEVDDAIHGFFDIVSDAVLSGKTYPLFDHLTGSLVREAIREGKITPSAASLRRSKQIGLSSDLLRRLPLFDGVPIDTILGIRQELDKPLIRFRSAITSYSKEIENASWDKDFPLEAEQIFREYVEPAVIEIDDSLRANSFLRRLLPSMVDAPIFPATGSFLGFTLASATDLPVAVAAGLGATAGMAANVLKHYQAWQERSQEIKGNQLYFYYEAGKKLEQKGG